MYRWDIKPCFNDYYSKLSCITASELSSEKIEQIINLPHGLQSTSWFIELAAKATERLVQLFGDAEAIGQAVYFQTDPLGIGKDFMDLSLASLIALLTSPLLKARSENSVLMILDAWSSTNLTSDQLRDDVISMWHHQLHQRYGGR